MGTYNCEACEELRNTDPGLIVNGLGDEECASLANNTGLVTTDDHDDFTDLNDLNDCLVKSMEKEMKAYDVCNWKDFMKRFIPNLWTVFKAMICALGGLWGQLSAIWEKLNKHDCMINSLFAGNTFEIGEDSSARSYIVPGGGVSYKFDNEGSGGRVSDVSALYIGGGLLRVQGTFRFFANDFTDADGTSRQGNHHWSETGPTVGGGELICEIRVLKSQFNVSGIFAGFGQETGGYDYSLNATAFTEGQWAYGQHGSCNSDGSAPSGHSAGHQVPAGYIYIQLRMSSIRSLNYTGTGKVSPRAFMGIRFNANTMC